MDLILHAKPKGEDGKQQIEEVIEAIKASSGPLGLIQKVDPWAGTHRHSLEAFNLQYRGCESACMRRCLLDTRV